MPDYSFGATGQLQELLDTIKQTQQNQKPQEPPTPAQIATEATMQGVNANNAAYAQQQAQAAAAQQAAQAQAAQQQQQLMNPAQWHYGKQMLGYKNAYENADTLAKALNPTVTDEAQLGVAADALRGLAHKNADNIRQIAKDAGIDLSGIEDASYADAQRNMLTRQTKEVADLLSGQGKYGRNADRYFDDEYRLLTAQGKSPSEAKRIAGNRAQRYQADRVTYLRNAYNMYGRDGNYTNEYGVPILQEIAMEMPEVANVYEQAYKLPTAAQERAEKLYDTERGYKQAFDIADQNFWHNIGLQGNQGQIQAALTQLRGQIEDALNANQSDRSLRNYGAQAEIDHNFWKDKENYKFLMEDKKWFTENERILRLAVAAGIKPEDAPKYVAVARNIKFGNDGKASKETIDNAKKLHDMTLSSIKDIRAQLEATQDENERKELEQKLKVNQDILTRIEDVAGDALGLSGGEEFPDYTGNEQEDLPVVVRLMEFQKTYGGTDEQLFEAVRNWVHKKDPQITDHFIRSLIQKAGKR